MDYGTMMQLFGTGMGAPGVPGMSQGGTMSAATAPALGSGLYGQDTLSGIFGMQSQGAGPMAGGNPGVQGTGTLLNSPLASPENVAKLAAAPIDPNKILQILASGQPRTGATPPATPASGRAVQFAETPQGKTQGYTPQSLAQLLGK